MDHNRREPPKIDPHRQGRARVLFPSSIGISIRIGDADLPDLGAQHLEMTNACGTRVTEPDTAAGRKGAARNLKRPGASRTRRFVSAEKERDTAVRPGNLQNAATQGIVSRGSRAAANFEKVDRRFCSGVQQAAIHPAFPGGIVGAIEGPSGKRHRAAVLPDRVVRRRRAAAEFRRARVDDRRVTLNWPSGIAPVRAGHPVAARGAGPRHLGGKYEIC